MAPPKPHIDATLPRASSVHPTRKYTAFISQLPGIQPPHRKALSFSRVSLVPGPARRSGIARRSRRLEEPFHGVFSFRCGRGHNRGRKGKAHDATRREWRRTQMLCHFHPDTRNLPSEYPADPSSQPLTSRSCPSSQSHSRERPRTSPSFVSKVFTHKSYGFQQSSSSWAQGC